MRSRRAIAMTPAAVAAMNLAAVLAVAVGVSSCSAASPPPPQATVQVYKSNGSVQCAGGGVDRVELARQLQAAGLQVIGARCGTDGRMHAARCGAADGRISIFELSREDALDAARLGFAPLSDLPEARVVPCP